MELSGVETDLEESGTFIKEWSLNWSEVIGSLTSLARFGQNLLGIINYSALPLYHLLGKTTFAKAEESRVKTHQSFPFLTQIGRNNWVTCSIAIRHPNHSLSQANRFIIWKLTENNYARYRNIFPLRPPTHQPPHHIIAGTQPIQPSIHPICKSFVKHNSFISNNAAVLPAPASWIPVQLMVELLPKFWSHNSRKVSHVSIAACQPNQLCAIIKMNEMW